MRCVTGASVLSDQARRVRSVTDLPDESLRCAAAGRHLGFFVNDPTWHKVGGWGRLNSWEITWRCDCTRWKREIVDRDTAETLSRSPVYGGGVLVAIGEVGQIGGIGVRDARVELWRRQAQQRRNSA